MFHDHSALCYYAMNSHVYLVINPDLITSMVEKAKAPAHKIKSYFYKSMMMWYIIINSKTIDSEIVDVCNINWMMVI